MSGIISDNTGRGTGLIKAAAGGKILQYVSATDDTERTTTSTSYVTASNTLTLVITPSATSSKILIFGHWTGGSNGTGIRYNATVQRDISGGTSNVELGSSGGGGLFSQEAAGSTAAEHVMACAITDSPSTTSECTYNFKFKVQSGTGYMNYGGYGKIHSYAMEIDGS